MITRGIIYIIINNVNPDTDYRVSTYNYIEEVIFSATSVRKTNKYLPITLIIDDPTYKNDLFDSIIHVKHDYNTPPRHSKIKFLLESPYDQTAFLDNDTQVMSDISGIFNYLDEGNISVGLIKKKDPKKEWYNTGVIVFDNKEVTKTFIKKWLKMCNNKGGEEESSFNFVSKKGIKLIELDLDIYNNMGLRLNKLHTPEMIDVTQSKYDKAKILHAHCLGEQWMQEKVNRRKW